MAELLRMRWEESDVRFGTVKLYSSKTKKWRTIKAPSAAILIANRKAARVAPFGYSHTRITGIATSWGTNLAMAGVPINGIKEYAGHASIVETQKYLKFMPQSIDLAASVSTRLAALATVK